ncbi:MAG: heme biosynthesis HemY N-terminal domain-containing protein [Lautropia sp.]|nr:heme biosynthesis HemY N-terminal domain-containing protein [Lautropia sp.]
MIRNVIWLLLAFAAAVVLALVFRGNHGNVALFWPPYRIELSANMLLVLLILGFFALHLLLVLLARTLGLPGRIRRYREQRRLQRNNQALQGAVLAHFEGRFDRAERLAASVLANTRGGKKDSGAAAALLAARSAHRLGAYQRRDDWTRQAARQGGRTAALMASAEFALEDHQPDKALMAVGRISVGGQQQLAALETSLAAYGESGRWDQVLETVRQLKRHGRLAPAEADVLRLNAYQQLLARRENDAEALNELWKSLTADERKKGMLVAPTVAALARADAVNDARRIAVGLLDTAYDESVLEVYAALETVPSRQRLEQLERWRLVHGERSKLLEMLGRICASERLWGKAEAYLLDALLAGDTVSARVALAQLYESVGKPQEAALQFQYAARLALGERPPMPEAIGTAALPGDRAPAVASSSKAPLPPDFPAPRLQGLGSRGMPLQVSAQEAEAASSAAAAASSARSGAAASSAAVSAGAESNAGVAQSRGH